MTPRVSVAIAVPVAFTVLITRAWQLFGDEPPAEARLGSLIVLALIAAWAIYFQPRTRAQPGMLALYWIVIGLFVIAVVRAARIGTYESWGIAFAQVSTLLLVGLIGVFAIAGGPSWRARTILLAVCCAPIVSVTVATVLYLTGLSPALQSPLEGNPPAEWLGALGITTVRLRFPLASSINSFGSLAGAGLVAALVLGLRTQSRLRIFACVGLISCGYVLLRTDSRGAIIYALIAVAFALLIPRIVKRAMSGLPLLLPLAPAVLLFMLGLLANTQIGESFARRGTDLGTATNRSYVWTQITDKFLHEPSISDVFGYGYFGHAESGVSSRYADILAGSQYAGTATAHNFVLQHALDIGYVGVAFILVLITLALHNLLQAHAANPSPVVLALAAMLVYFTLAGFTDPTPSLYYDDSMFVWLLVLAAAMRPDLGSTMFTTREERQVQHSPRPRSLPSQRTSERRAESVPHE